MIQEISISCIITYLPNKKSLQITFIKKNTVTISFVIYVILVFTIYLKCLIIIPTYIYMYLCYLCRTCAYLSLVKRISLCHVLFLWVKLCNELLVTTFASLQNVLFSVYTI